MHPKGAGPMPASSSTFTPLSGPIASPSPRNGHLVDAVHDVAVLVPQFVPRLGEADVRNTPEQCLEHHLQLDASQLGADAVVQPVPEGDVLAIATADVELVRVRE